MKHFSLFVCWMSFSFLTSWGVFAEGSQAKDTSTLAPLALACEYLPEPLGMDETHPRLSWKVESGERGQRQSAYRILVASSEEKLSKDVGDLWDSGKVSDARTTQVEYAGRPLGSRQECFWKVRVWDNDSKSSGWSERGRWSMGLLDASDWKADWISFRDESPLHKSRKELYLPPPRLYRKEFASAKPIRRATLYASALGNYEIRINESRVSEARFLPGWSDYRKRAYYNTSDVTDLVRGGENVIGAFVADGWYSGYVGYGLLVGYGPNKCGRYFYGKTPALIAQLEIEYVDGSREAVGTDASWKVTQKHPIREADILMGETYDARLELTAWSKPGYKTGGWKNAILAEENGSTKAMFYDRAGEREVELGFVKPAIMQAYPGPPVRTVEEIKPVKMTEPEKGVFIFDMGQNFSGVVRLKVKGERNDRVRLRFGEMLHSDGKLMTENLRKARATDLYILRGDPEGETWTPQFTYHGFQFVEITGYPGRPGLDAITGVVIHSDTPLTSSFECSDPMVNQLFKNIVWTQRSNFLEIPTDCPQRDERLGWTGDAQAYVRAATYNADVSAFFTKWEYDLVESQGENGAYPAYAPFPMQHGVRGKAFGSAWMDAGVICPYTIYQVYGDTRMIKRNWDSMTRFMDFRRENAPNFQGVFVGNDWGDWLALGKTPIEYIDAIYFAYTSKLMAEMADGIGRSEDAEKYRSWFKEILATFNKNYVNENGSLAVNTQTAYALALFVGMLPSKKQAMAGEHLAQLIEQEGNLMTTGFLGTRPLLPALTATGHNDLAVRLLQNRGYPSWGYEVENGATTIWERWNSYTRGKGFMNAGMNSFSHYSFGAVCEWMFQSLAGIDTETPGFQKIIIRPCPPTTGTGGDAEAIHWVRARYDSIHGPITSNWRVEKNRFEIEIGIPANADAMVYLPAQKGSTITESGKSLDQAMGVKLLAQKDKRRVLRITSGTYRFLVKDFQEPIK